jgi:hypothetical protein
MPKEIYPENCRGNLFAVLTPLSEDNTKFYLGKIRRESVFLIHLAKDWSSGGRLSIP